MYARGKILICDIYSYFSTKLCGVIVKFVLAGSKTVAQRRLAVTRAREKVRAGATLAHGGRLTQQNHVPPLPRPEDWTGP